MEIENYEVSEEEFEKLIYNPNLPTGWEDMGFIEKTRMFHMLFYTLHEDFREKWGRAFRGWFKFFKAIENGGNITKYGKQLSVDAWKTTDFLVSERLIFSPLELYHLLYRKAEEDVENLLEKFYEHINKFYEDKNQIVDGLCPNISFLPSGCFDNPQTVRDFWPNEKKLRHVFEDYIRSRGKEKDGIVCEIFLCIDISWPKEKILKDFKEYIDKYHELYFKKFPEERKLEYGHLPRKGGDKGDNKRVNAPRFEILARYFSLHVDYELGMSKDGLEKEYLENAGDARSSIDTDLLNAKNLIINAWNNDFPGVYSRVLKNKKKKADAAEKRFLHNFLNSFS